MEYPEEALGVVKTSFRPMTAAQIDQLAAKTKQAASSGKYELYRTSATSIRGLNSRIGSAEGPPAGVSE